MDDDDKKPSTIPLLHDMVYDQSLPLRPPKRPRRPKAEKPSTPPGYDPDTIDLFGDVEPPLDVDDLDEEAMEEFRDSAEQMIDDLVEEQPPACEEHEEKEEISQRLRSELTEQLTSILDDLAPQNSDKQG